MQCKWIFTKPVTFLHHKENSSRKHALRSHFLKSYSGANAVEFAKRLYVLSSFTSFVELGFIQYHSDCELQTGPDLTDWRF